MFTVNQVFDFGLGVQYDISKISYFKFGVVLGVANKVLVNMIRIEHIVHHYSASMQVVFVEPSFRLKTSIS